MSCASDEVETIVPGKLDTGAVSGVSIMGILILGFIISYLVIRFQTNRVKTGVKANTVTGEVYKTLFDRLGGFFGGSVGQFSIGMLVAILVSDVVSAFNGLIITPIVQVAIPDQKVFTTGIDLGRNVWFYPGQFFLSLLGFVISLLVLFFIIEGFYQISRLPKTRQILKYVFIVSIIGVLIGLMIWNIYAVVEVESKDTTVCTKLPNSCEGCQVYPEGSKVVQTGSSGALGTLSKVQTQTSENPIPPITPMTTYINPMGGVRFSI